MDVWQGGGIPGSGVLPGTFDNAARRRLVAAQQVREISRQPLNTYGRTQRSCRVTAVARHRSSFRHRAARAAGAWALGGAVGATTFVELLRQGTPPNEAAKIATGFVSGTASTINNFFADQPQGLCLSGMAVTAEIAAEANGVPFGLPLAIGNSVGATAGLSRVLVNHVFGRRPPRR